MPRLCIPGSVSVGRGAERVVHDSIIFFSSCRLVLASLVFELLPQFPGVDRIPPVHQQGEAIVKHDDEKNGPLVPPDFDLQSAKNLEMNGIFTRRRIVTSYRNESEMALYGTIRKEGFGYNAKYYSNTLTDL